MSKEAPKERNFAAEAALKRIDQRAVAITERYVDVDDAELNSLSEMLGSKDGRIKKLSDATIIHRYNAGNAISADAFEKIKDKVDADGAVEFTAKVPTYEKGSVPKVLLPYEEWTVQKYVRNKHVNDLQRLDKTDGLKEDVALNLHELEENAHANLDRLNAQKGIYQSEKRSISAVQHTRTRDKIVATRAEKRIKTQTIRQMFEKQFGKVVVKEVITA